LLDTPGVNDGLSLKSWKENFNKVFGASKMEPLILMVIKHNPRPSKHDKQDLEILAELYE